MKRKIALICMLTMVCSSVICACGGSAEAETEEAVVEEEATPEPTVEPTPTPEPLKIVLKKKLKKLLFFVPR